MFRMHSRRIGPGTLVVLALLSLAALAAIAAFEVAGFDPVSPAFAQTPSPVTQTPSPVTLSGLFGFEEADLKTTQPLKDAINKPPRKCYPPRVKFTVEVPDGGDRLFQETLAGARQEALQNSLPSLGLEPGQFKVDVIDKVDGVDGVEVSYGKFTPEDDKDREAPKLKVTSIPKQGSKVKAGEKITVTITASERYEDGHKSWPTGVESIQLLDDNGSVPGGSKNYGRPTLPCEARTFVVTYTVPPKPPLIVHLTAMVEDGVGNSDSKVAEFPTGDVWEGTLMTGVTVTGAGETCTGTWKAKIKIVAGKDGKVSDWGSIVDDAPMNSCGGTYAIVGSKLPITASANDAGFTIPLSSFLGGQSEGSAFIEKKGGTNASGTANPSYSPGAGLTNSFVMKFELKCKTCAP